MTSPQSGIIIVDKPQGITSHGVVARMRRVCGTRKVGHGGTLDPMATGVLIVAVGRGTKLLTYVSGLDKSYAATVRLGSSTVTDDAEGEVTAVHDASGVSDEAIRAALDSMTGEIDQVPSAVSAVKVDGKRAYRRMREGETVALRSRRVTVASISTGPIRRTGGPGAVDVDIDVSCSSGTYIRAIARDLGDELGVGGHLTALRRTRVGGFGLDEAASLDELVRRFEAGAPVDLMPLGRAAARLMPTRTASAAEARALSFGRSLDEAGIPGRYAVLDAAGDLLAVMADRDGRARPETVFAAAG